MYVVPYRRPVGGWGVGRDRASTFLKRWIHTCFCEFSALLLGLSVLTSNLLGLVFSSKTLSSTLISRGEKLYIKTQNGSATNAWRRRLAKRRGR